jgi:hypothetical protein
MSSVISRIWTQISAKYELSDQHNMNPDISDIWAQLSAQYGLRDQRNISSVISTVWTPWSPQYEFSDQYGLQWSAQLDLMISTIATKMTIRVMEVEITKKVGNVSSSSVMSVRTYVVAPESINGISLNLTLASQWDLYVPGLDRIRHQTIGKVSIT